MFYLVGSRFYGTHRDDSDWDYLAENNAKNRERCERMGLQVVPSPPTGGTHYWGRYQGRTLDILLVDDVMRRVYARDVLAKLPEVKQLSKSERHRRVREIIDTSTL